MIKKGVLTLFVVMLVLSAIGCAQNGGSSDGNAAAGKDVKGADTVQAPPEETGPVTLQMYQGAALTDDEFQKLIADPVKKKYPNVTVNMVKKPDAKTTHEDMLNQLITGNNIPDLIFIDAGAISLLKKLGLNNDLTSLAKTYKFDWSQLDQNSLDTVKQQGEKGELYAIPFSINPSALFYNKDIFDKFGVPYPKDGMTWQETIDLGKKVERSESGTSYHGLASGQPNYLTFPLSMPLVDPKSGKSNLQADGWKKALQLYKDILDASGQSGGILPFFQNRNIAMLPNPINLISNLLGVSNQGISFNWDIAGFPSYPDKPGISSFANIPSVTMTSNSKHKDTDFRVLSYLVSSNVQELVAKEGRVSVLKDAKYKDIFGADLAGLQGKHLQGVFASTPAKTPPTSPYDDLVGKELNAAMDKVRTGKADINTALRDAEEAANKAIGEAQTK